MLRSPAHRGRGLPHDEAPTCLPVPDFHVGGPARARVDVARSRPPPSSPAAAPPAGRSAGRTRGTRCRATGPLEVDSTAAASSTRCAATTSSSRRSRPLHLHRGHRAARPDGRAAARDQEPQAHVRHAALPPPHRDAGRRGHVPPRRDRRLGARPPSVFPPRPSPLLLRPSALPRRVPASLLPLSPPGARPLVGQDLGARPRPRPPLVWGRAALFHLDGISAYDLDAKGMVKAHRLENIV